METPDAKYTYQPLQFASSFRVIQLEASNGDLNAPLRCQLVESAGLRSEAYEALSYTWGIDAPSKTLYIKKPDRSSQHDVLTITENLHTALQHLRLPDAARTLWVDALCINQSDLPEKSHQVARMGDIFRRASRVVVWLGKVPCSRKFQKEGAVWLENVANCRNLPQDEFIGQHSLRDFSLFARLLEITLLRSQWFTRVWVIQEFVLAKEVYFQCGALQLDEDLVRRAVDAIVYIIKYRTSTYIVHDQAWKLLEAAHTVKDLFDFRQLAQKGQSTALAQSVFDLTRNRFCTQAVDRIYSLLGISGQVSLEPDYETPPAQVFRDFARKSLENAHLSILHECSISSQDRDQPSWVPRLTSAADTGTKIWRPTASWTAGKSFTPRFQSLDEHRISLSGVHVDTITDSIETQERRHPDADHPMKSIQFDHSLIRSYRLLITQLTGTPHEPHNAENLVVFPPYAEPLYSVFKSTITSIASRFVQAKLESPTHVTVYYAQEVKRRNVLRTKEGFLGLGSRDVRVGDEVVVFDGDTTPFVVRRVEGEGKGVFRIVGDCYLHGWMEGDYFGRRVVEEEDGPGTGDGEDVVVRRDFVIC